ncbi:Phosphate-specific transport system accessory protein PhoU [Planctomycetales bacterium 10988]|nr:Phosphate-specific transport system accessory protein PhoU [Planctomycetales bacterium 10988]
MTLSFQRQAQQIKRMIVQLGALVEESVERSIRAIETRDCELAEAVVRDEPTIDRFEVEVEEQCLQTLALYQPVADNLRFLIVVIKINKDLERIADLAANMAKQAMFLADLPPLERFPFDLDCQTQRVRNMLQRSLDALVNADSRLAEEVRVMDIEVDEVHRTTYERVQEGILKSPQDVDRLIHLLNISRQLERIADLTVNIAEDVLYYTQGKIHRHQRIFQSDEQQKSERRQKSS